MTSSKQLICSQRRREVPAQFSWIDQRLVREHYLDQLDAYAMALYLFLVTVADAQGLSWYGDGAIVRILSMDTERLHRSRTGLIQAQLLAYVPPVYQILALDKPLPPKAAPHPTMVSAPTSTLTTTDISASTTVQAHLKALHDALGKRP